MSLPFNLHVGELKNLWQKIIMKAIVKTMHGEKAEKLVNEEVVHKESLYRMMLENLLSI